MRISQYFGLSLSQGQVDFVDVPVDHDARLFVDPTAIRHAIGPFRDECVSLLQDFFSEVIGAIQRGDHPRALSLLAQLSEPSEARLGYARRGSHGLGVGSYRARQIWEALKESEATATGLLQDLEDTALLIDGIDVDMVSDVALNVLRGPLISYTQAMAETYGMPMQVGVASGPIWDPARKGWTQHLTSLPVATSGKVLLVPKLFVRRALTYSASDYYTHYILTNLQAEHLAAGTGLVEVLRDGRKRVLKKDLRKQYPESKSLLLSESLRNPRLLERYRADRRREPRPPSTDLELVDRAEYDPPAYAQMLDELRTIPRGRSGEAAYHDQVFGLLTALFAPRLIYPEKEVKLHEGRKRVDIAFHNAATEGFFSWVADRYGAQYVFIECKNYAGDPKNPELDQLAGRFSPRRGRFGILACRELKDRALFEARCRDTADDDRGYILPLDDSDLSELVEARMEDGEVGVWRCLRERFNRLVL